METNPLHIKFLRMTLACSYYNGSNPQPSLLNASTDKVPQSQIYLSAPLTKSISEEREETGILFCD